MKRTRLTRKTPMPPPKAPMKRSPINKVSDDKRRTDREQKPLLDDYRKRFPRCQCCGWRYGSEIHEMAGGGSRKRARGRRSCILHLCGLCHKVVQYWPKEKQLACKLVRDHAGYDLAEFCDVLGRKIEQRKVDEYMPEVR
jgi:hypothetical protein